MATVKKKPRRPTKSSRKIQVASTRRSAPKIPRRSPPRRQLEIRPMVSEADEEIVPENQIFTDMQYSATTRLLAAAASKSFTAFLAFLYPPGHSKYILSKLHMFLAHLVQACVDGLVSARQATSVPPQMGKSSLLAVRAVAWLVGYCPGISIGLSGFSHNLLTKFTSEIRTIMMSPRYRLTFPGVDSVYGSDRQDEIYFTNGSSIVVKSCGTKFTGRRLDWLIIDDAHAGRWEAENKSAREKIKTWYYADCMSRLAPNARVWIVGTRWHKDDLIGHLTSPEYVKNLELLDHREEIYDVVNLPAIAEHDPDRGETCPLGREPGEAIFPEERNILFLMGKKAILPKYEWDSQFRGQPTTAGAGQANLRMINPITIDEVPTDIAWVRGWDLALGEKKTNDYSVGALCAYKKEVKKDGEVIEEDHFYLIHIWRNKKVWAKLKPLLVAVALKDKKDYGSNMMGLEAVSGFDIGLSELRTSLKGKVTIKKKNPKPGGKLMRALDWINYIDVGKFSMVEGAWNKDFLDELEGFPEGDNDDQVDGVSISWECTRRKNKLQYA